MGQTDFFLSLKAEIVYSLYTVFSNRSRSPQAGSFWCYICSYLYNLNSAVNKNTVTGLGCLTATDTWKLKHN